MTVFRSFHAASAHPGRYWATRESSLDINRVHVLGLVLTLVLFLLLLNMITTASGEETVEEPSAGTTGFRGLPVSEDLSLRRRGEEPRVLPDNDLCLPQSRA